MSRLQTEFNIQVVFVYLYKDYIINSRYLTVLIIYILKTEVYILNIDLLSEISY